MSVNPRGKTKPLTLNTQNLQSEDVSKPSVGLGLLPVVSVCSRLGTRELGYQPQTESCVYHTSSPSTFSSSCSAPCHVAGLLRRRARVHLLVPGPPLPSIRRHQRGQDYQGTRKQEPLHARGPGMSQPYLTPPLPPPPFPARTPPFHVVSCSTLSTCK